MAILRVEEFTATADVLGLVKRVRYSKGDGELAIEATSADEAVSILAKLAVGRVEGLTAKATPEGEAVLVRTAFKEEAQQEVRQQAPPPPPPPTNVVDVPDEEPAPQAEAVEPDEPDGVDDDGDEEPAPQAKAQAPAKKRSRRKKPVEAPAKVEPAPQVEAPVPQPEPVAAAPAKATPATSVQADVEAMAAAEPQAAPAGGNGAQATSLLPTAPEPAAPPPAPAAATGNGGMEPELLDAKKIRDVVNYWWEKGITKPDDIVARCLAVKDDVKVLARIRNVEERVRRAITVMGLGS